MLILDRRAVDEVGVPLESVDRTADELVLDDAEAAAAEPVTTDINEDKGIVVHKEVGVEPVWT